MTRVLTMVLLASCGAQDLFGPLQSTQPPSLSIGQEAFVLSDGGWDVETPGVTCSARMAIADAGLQCCPNTTLMYSLCVGCIDATQCQDVAQGTNPDCSASEQTPICGSKTMSCCGGAF